MMVNRDDKTEVIIVGEIYHLEDCWRIMKLFDSDATRSDGDGR